MEGKEIKCSCKFIFTKVILVSGIIVGAVLALLGIVTITGDTRDLFKDPFVQWYTTDIYHITFTDQKGLSNHDIWPRPHQYISFEWTSQHKRFVQECDSKYVPLSKGFKTRSTEKGAELVTLKNLTIEVHYYCVSSLEDSSKCDGSSSYQGRIHLYKGSLFQTNGSLGNQNFRWTFFWLACLMIVFGVVMILGELHVPLVTTKFTFFYYSFVKGLVYIAVGFLVMGMSNLFGLLVAILLWAIGILNCVYGWKSVTTFQWSKVGARGTTTIVTRREYI